MSLTPHPLHLPAHRLRHHRMPVATIPWADDVFAQDPLTVTASTTTATTTVTTATRTWRQSPLSLAITAAVNSLSHHHHQHHQHKQQQQHAFYQDDPAVAMVSTPLTVATWTTTTGSGATFASSAGGGSYRKDGYFFLVWAVVVALMALALVTLVSNSTILTMFVLRKSVRKCKNIYIASLAAADLGIGLSIPIAVLEQVENRWVLQGWACHLYQTVRCSLLYVSLLSILLITVDRWWSIHYPFSYRVRQSKRLAAVAVTVVWLASFALHVPPVLLWDFFVGLENAQAASANDDVIHTQSNDVMSSSYVMSPGDDVVRESAGVGSGGDSLLSAFAAAAYPRQSKEYVLSSASSSSSSSSSTSSSTSALFASLPSSYPQSAFFSALTTMRSSSSSYLFSSSSSSSSSYSSTTPPSSGPGDPSSPLRQLSLPLAAGGGGVAGGEDPSGQSEGESPSGAGGQHRLFTRWASGERARCELPYDLHFSFVLTVSVVLYFFPLLALWVLNCSLFFKITRRKSIKIRRSLSVNDNYLLTFRKSSSESESSPNNGTDSDASGHDIRSAEHRQRLLAAARAGRRHTYAFPGHSVAKFTIGGSGGGSGGPGSVYYPSRQPAARRVSLQDAFSGIGNVAALAGAVTNLPRVTSYGRFPTSGAGSGGGCLNPMGHFFSSGHRHSVCSSRKQSEDLVKELLVRQDKKAARLLGLLVTVFTLCWLPYTVVAVLRANGPDAIAGWLRDLTFWVLITNSAINPFLYGLLNAEFRKILRGWFYFRRRNDFRLKHALLYWSLPMNGESDGLKDASQGAYGRFATTIRE